MVQLAHNDTHTPPPRSQTGVRPASPGAALGDRRRSRTVPRAQAGYNLPMAIHPAVFRRSERRQIEINRARTPTERFLALCDLLEAAHAMLPQDPRAVERRRRAQRRRLREREEFREFCRRCVAAERAGLPPRV
jgi:hypothetical protein